MVTAILAVSMGSCDDKISGGVGEMMVLEVVAVWEVVTVLDVMVFPDVLVLLDVVVTLEVKCRG